ADVEAQGIAVKEFNLNGRIARCHTCIHICHEIARSRIVDSGGQKKSFAALIHPEKSSCSSNLILRNVAACQAVIAIKIFPIELPVANKPPPFHEPHAGVTGERVCET